MVGITFRIFYESKSIPNCLTTTITLHEELSSKIYYNGILSLSLYILWITKFFDNSKHKMNFELKKIFSFQFKIF